VTGANIKQKQNERVFIQRDRDPVVKVTQEITELWENLIADYQKIHVKDLKERERNNQSPSAYLGHDPGQTAWSRHVYDPNQRQLQEGILCYVQLKQGHNEKKPKASDVIALQPVTISRRLYNQKPAELLPDHLHPAVDISKRSPADRVFGWVNQNGQGSYKGQLRVHSVSCHGDDAVDNFGSAQASFPLAILGQPKPEQARFYCANDSEGKPIPKGKAKQEGYKDKNQNLRGRKVYPHHKGLPKNYWNNPLEDRTQKSDNTGHYQEYRQPQKDGVEQQSEQNRSIQGWVKPETKFQFEIDVINLSSVELGALLWLLASPDVYYHRLGGAKPLGFGSVWLDINWDCTDLRLGSEWAEFYQSLTPKPPKISNGISCIDDFKKSVVSAYGINKGFEQIEFISAFCNSSKGFDNAAIHYPRVTPHPKPEGEAFEWFVRNEQESNRAPGLKLSLPNLADSQPASLPTDPVRKKNNKH